MLICFRHISHSPAPFSHANWCRISNPDDSVTWKLMLNVKSIILRKMDSYPPGVRICCVKFIQRVVQTQTPAVIADPRVCSAKYQFGTYTANMVAATRKERDFAIFSPTRPPLTPYIRLRSGDIGSTR